MVARVVQGRTHNFLGYSGLGIWWHPPFSKNRSIVDNFNFPIFLNLVLLFSIIPSMIIGGVIWLSYLTSRRKALREERSASDPKMQRRIDQPQRSYPVWLLLMVDMGA